MDPEELEFIGERVSIGIIPNFNFDAIHLIAGTVGPFKAGLPLHIPLWLAIHLRKQQKCRIVPPSWMDRDILEDKKEEEKRVPNFTSMPCDQYMIVSKLLFSCASEDIPSIEEIKTFIKDIYDIRQAKLRTAIDSLFIGKKQLDGTTQVSFTNLTMFEIHTVRSFLPYASDLIARLERVCQQHTSNTNDTVHSNSFFSSSSGY
ncbi:probable DNA replication complex GINS protein PSF2 [Chironomus tepperi]|uniref:probable DNA replication complex GINS protein PSF2 n=1 Tax=Chironomus tepperi TaxID=113505 RepID=UPI00391F080D